MTHHIVLLRNKINIFGNCRKRTSCNWFPVLGTWGTIVSPKVPCCSRLPSTDNR